MRSLSVPAALFFAAVSATAQLHVGPEISTGLMPVTAPAVRPAPIADAAPEPGGALLVWSTRSANGHARATIARLNGQGGAVALQELPAFDGDADVVNAAVASRGDAALVVWIEKPAAGTGRVAATLVDAQFHLLHRENLNLTATGLASPRVAWDGAGFTVTAGNMLLRFSADGALVSSTSTDDRTLGSVTARDGAVALVSYRLQQVSTFFCTSCPHDEYELEVRTAGGASRALTGTYARLAPAIAGARDGYLAVFPMLSDVSHYAVGAATVTPAGVADLGHAVNIGSMGFVVDAANDAAAPQVAFDGERDLIVWQAIEGDGRPHVHAALFDGVRFGEAFAVADGGHPFVAATGRGTFLVGYDVVEGDQHRIAGRFVTLNAPPRRRIGS
jgi:hypothetical protein